MERNGEECEVMERMGMSKEGLRELGLIPIHNRIIAPP